MLVSFPQKPLDKHRVHERNSNLEQLLRSSGGGGSSRFWRHRQSTIMKNCPDTGARLLRFTTILHCPEYMEFRDI